MPEDPEVAATTTGTSLPVADDAAVRSYARYLLLRHRGAFAIVLLFQGVAAVAALVGPQVLGDLVEGLSNGTAGDIVDRSILIFLAALTVQTGVTWLGRLRAGILGEEILADLREDFLRQTVALPPGVIERAGTGDLVSRTTTDVDRLSWAVRDAVPEMALAAVTAVVVGGALIVTAPQLALVWLVSVPILAIPSRWYFRRAGRAYRAEGATYAAVGAGIAETSEAGQTVEAYRLGRARRAETDSRISRWIAWERYTLALRTRFFPAVELGYVLPLVLVLAVGGYAVTQGSLSLAVLTTAVLYTQLLVEPLDLVLSWFDELQVGQASLARLVGVHKVPPADVDNDLEPDGEQLSVDDVFFAYRAGRDVLHGIDLEIPPGERLALVGPSGAGKSTLGRLLAGIYAPRAGSIELGGAELARMPPERARSHVVLVNQEHHVFVGTVRENLLLAKEEATDDEVWAALAAVDAVPWVESLSDGLDTEVGSGKIAVPPAQAQQLALARLVLADPHTLVLDEATSLLDPRAARHLERSLGALLVDRTVIAIAHRLHTAYDADRIAVVEDGQITELGSHEELLAAQGPYAALWQSWRDAD